LMDEGSFRVRVRRRKISRRSLWFALPGLLLISLDISLIRWSLTLPGDLGNLFFSTVFGVGVALILFSPDLARVKPPELSGIYGEQIKKWETSRDIVIMLQNLSSTETSNLVDTVSGHFGKIYSQNICRSQREDLDCQGSQSRLHDPTCRAK